MFDMAVHSMNTLGKENYDQCFVQNAHFAWSI